MSSVDTSVYKLKEFSLFDEGSAEDRYNAKLWKLEDLMENCKMKIVNLDSEDLEFDIIGLGPPIVNAIRRILMAEVPTMAIDKVHMLNNTTVIPDEVLAHRLGLIPIKVDPRVFVNKAPGEDDTEGDTLKFELKVKCTRKPNAPKDIFIFDESSCNHCKVLSKDLKFIPMSNNQKEIYGDIRPVHEDILIAVMRPGHEIDLEAFCYKNIGREHAKFSPVVVASYRLLPQLRLLQEVSGELAHTLADHLPKGVIKISKKKDKEIAKVADARKMTCNRNVLCHEELKDIVEICKVKDHYIFTVESSGILSPDTLVIEAINILKGKCCYFLKELKSLKM